MNSDKALWGSISILIGTVIGILALVRGPLQIWLLLGIFALWGLWVVAFLLLPYMREAKRRKVRQQQIKQRQAEGISPAFHVPEVGGEPTELLLLRHVNHRISIYLQAAYPKVTWEWCEKQPEKLILHGGVGRIRVFGVEDFDHADIKLDQKANISCDMVKIVPLAKAGYPDGGEAQLPPNQQPVDPQIWYEIQGRKVLEALMADLNSRGHSSLTLSEEGDIHVEQGEDDVVQEHLSGFPAKVYWPRLVQVFERNGLAAEITAKGVQVSW
ncbi:hypothetical protein DS742_17490 [Lacrimispora amygdalina]|uniref:Uncharacterized protein n=1 Tax=Lacrimispora amygdalina TaxID=253257 RepID=A0A3E2N9C0_9FIRM|nr:hypothetical protein [Clostridium indicum]RFZ77609.1 hypothetical protein DS742_17490 [Clostridium indicum]